MPKRDGIGDSIIPRLYRILSLVTSVMAFQSANATAQDPAPTPTTRFVLTMTASGQIRRDATIQIQFNVVVARPSPSAEFRVSLPPGMRLVTGDSIWEGSLSAGERKVFPVVVELTDTGISRLGGLIRDTTPDVVPGLVNESYAGLYFAVGRRTGFSEKDLSERFVAPGRRALWALEHVSGKDMIRSPDATSERQVYGNLRGVGTNAARLSRALRAIDSAGVEALFDDSVAQVERVRSALSDDLNSPGANLAPPSGAALLSPQAVAASCPVGTALRAGYVEYFNVNSGLNERLPNILVEAASAPHTFSRTWTQFRSQADGSFNACFPFDAQGFTYITLWQDIGPVIVYRDGASPPAAFPNWWDAAWDLNQSPSIPMNTHHPEVSFSLLTWYRGVNASYTIFTSRRSQLASWYFGNTDTDYYCSSFMVFGGCTKSSPGEAIYTHRFAPDQAGRPTENIWSPFGQFVRLHEYGHGWNNAVMGGVNGTDCSGSHGLYSPNTIGCASKEGWADFFSVITLPNQAVLANIDAEANFGSGQDGFKVEATVMSYLFDLVDKAGFPSFRKVAADDDEVSVSPDYLVQVLRDGRTNFVSPPAHALMVLDIIDIIDNITPIPNKPEFSGFFQPTSIVTRVTRPASITVSQNRALWLFDIFNRTESPIPLAVAATVPGFVTVKSVQNISGSASGGAGGYTGWLWERCDNCNGAGYTWWSDQQNSQFVAYAGSYTIFWRLSVSDRAASRATTQAQTIVCIPQSPSCLAAIAEPVASLSANHDASAAHLVGSAPIIVQPVGGYFGAGPWISSDAGPDSSSVELYSLSGSHDAWAPGDPWPNSFALRPNQVSARRILLDSNLTTVAESLVAYSSNVSLVRLQFVSPTAQRQYHVSYAIDPDLGRSPLDDRLIWLDSAGVAVVLDPDSGAVAYGWLSLPQGSAVAMREYGDSVTIREPWSRRLAFQEQRRQSRNLGRVGDVRFITTLGPISPGSGRLVTATLVAARGTTPTAAVTALLAVRRSQSQTSTLAAGESSRNSQRQNVRVRQNLTQVAYSLSPGLVARRGSMLAAAKAGDTVASVLERDPAASPAQVKRDGIIAADIQIPDDVGPIRLRIMILDLVGRVVRQASDETLGPGTYTYRWDGVSDSGSKLPPGVYQILVQGKGYTARTRLVLTR